MGLYYRYTAALLTLVFLSSTASAAVRQSVNPSAKSVIENYTFADFQTPNGFIHYIGPDKYYALDTSLNAQAGTKIAPTIRPVASTIGTPSFPYGGAAVMNASPIIDVKPGKLVPPSKIISGAKNLLRLTPSALASSLMFSALLETALWVFDEESQSYVMEKQIPLDDPSLALFQSVVGFHPSAQTACQADIAAQGQTYNKYVMIQNGNAAACYARLNDGRIVQLSSVGRTGNCPQDATYTSGYCSVTALAPVSNADIDNLDLTGQNVDFYTGLMRDTCSASSSPDACYDEMVDSSSLSGPATVAGPSTTSTTTSTNPDGSTSTTTTTTSTQHDISYGNDHFDVGTKQTTTTEKDGQQVSTTITEDTSSPTDSPAEEPEESYTFDDSPLPEVEPFYEPQYPDGLAGVWDSASAEISSSAFLEFLGSFVPSFSGSCPAFGLNMNVATWAAFGTFDFFSLCYVFDFIKIIFLVTALFTARIIMFGG